MTGAEPFHDMNAQARRSYLIEIRTRLGMIQTVMAVRLGMSARAYSDLETGKAECRPIHILAAERVTLQEAKLREDADLLAPSVKQEIAAIVARGFTASS